MEQRRQLCSLARLVLPAMGFAMICVGAYLVSLQSNGHATLWIILAYVLIACGFLVMLTGVSWTICHGMKSKMYQRGGRNHSHDQLVHIFTIDRPSSYPPSYEESERRQAHPEQVGDFVVEVDGELGLAPPVYTKDSSEIPDYTLCLEQPPPYTQTTTPRQEDTEE